MYQTENYTNPIKHEVPLPTEAGLFCENDKTRTMKRIAIQGIKGSYHDMAAHYFFHNEDIELICCSTFEEVFATVKDDSTILGMAAIENTIAGSLLHNYELLCDSGLTIVGEHKLRISHSLLCLPDDNLEDITMRQLRLLGEVDFLAAEDTRVTRKLLSHYDIHTPIVSYHEHSGLTVAQSIADRILAGESCGVVTDAGMPCISDPGEPLVQLCHQLGVPMEVVPGPSAAIAALAISGQHTSRFAFEGFLSVNRNQRAAHLEQLRDEQRTMIFYEAPHKLCRTLADMAAVFGGDRSLSLCRELTKIHEEVQLTTFAQAIAYYENTPPRGEYVLVVAGAVPQKAESITLEEAVEQVRRCVADGQKLTQACKTVAAETGYRKSELYDAVQES